MATYNKGILGQFNGKVGTVIGSSWKGISYMRSLPKKSSKEPSAAQFEHRLKFSLVASFLKPIAALVKPGYQTAGTNLSPYNAALAHHLKNAVAGTSPDFVMDYPQVVFSRGELLGVSAGQMTAEAGAGLAITWLDNSSGMAKGTDKAVVLVFEPSQKLFVYADEGATRADGTYLMDLDTPFIGKSVEVWMAFFAADQASVSTSIYLGNTTILS